MIMGYVDPFEAVFAFQRALENRRSDEWLGTPLQAAGPSHP